ncbi:cystatin-like [Acipenser oxyrinchus oxyrinchus]|uniref:Cystatin-like n=1 Tax=Acipenser oxyrinchus oxyrinchus TaxID=40147 RepID=A0AAD8GBJ2_ACIOX|nr:cystatin-like [Acipenser oxyrinchus oxyrinchus]
MIVCWQGIGVLVSVAILSVSTGPIVVQKKDNQSSNGVSDALNYALQSYNFMSKEQYLYKSLNFTLQTIQVMNGKEYVIDAEIGRTECLKGISAQYLSDCTLMQNPGNMQILACHFVVLTWRDKNILLQSICKDNQ